MTQDQMMAMLRQIIPVLAGLAIGAGWLSAEQAATWTTTLFQIAGPILAIAGVVWSWFANSKQSILTSAANMPEVKEVKMTNTPEAKELVKNTPDNVS